MFGPRGYIGVRWPSHIAGKMRINMINYTGEDSASEINLAQDLLG